MNISVEDSRLGWLLRENAIIQSERERFRSDRERDEMLLLSRPVDSQKSWGRFGFYLGGIPPFAIFIRLLSALSILSNPMAVCIAIIMLFICVLTGSAMGRALSGGLHKAERRRWSLMLFLSFLAGLSWGAVTGGAGGLIVFGFGVIPGAIIGASVGAMTFPFFISLHRLTARGGMIEERNLRALCVGISMIVAAFIMGL